MRSRTILASAILTAAFATEATAQSQGIAIVPFAGFVMPGTLAEEDGGGEMAPKGSPLAGLQLELGLSKNLSFGIGGMLAIGQTMDFNDNSGGSSVTFGSADLGAMRIFGILSLRPSGRRPNGAVTPLAIEFGGGITMWKIKEFTVDLDGDGIQETNIPVDDWDGNEPFAFGGLAYNLPIGPRSSIQIFGRAIGGFGYSSQGLDDFNAQAPVTNIEGNFNLSFVIGAGLRVGR